MSTDPRAFADGPPDRYAVQPIFTSVEAHQREMDREEAAHLQTIDQRDRAEEWADRLAYAIAPQGRIGEHSSMNNPWANALELAVPVSEHEALQERLQRLLDAIGDPDELSAWIVDHNGIKLRQFAERVADAVGGGL